MDDPNTLKPNTLYSLINNDLLLYQTDSQGIPIDLVTGEQGPAHRSYKELENSRSTRFLAWQMQGDGQRMIDYGLALEKIVGGVNDLEQTIQTQDSTFKEAVAEVARESYERVNLNQALRTPR